MIDFPIVKIGELINSGEAKVQTGPFGTQLKASDYSAHGYPVINVRNVGFGDIRSENLEFIDDRIAEKLTSHRLLHNDIVFGRKGAVERHGLITEAQEGWYQGSDCLRLRFNSSRINPKFISYFFRTQAHQDWMMAVCAFGATMASLNQDIVKLINVPVPPLDIQNKIVGLLSAYDDLIKNNKRRITLLENMAEEIYREWFVRFRFPGWQEAEFEKGLPVNWQTSGLGQIATFVMGQSPKSEFYNRNRDGLPFHQGVGTFGKRFPAHEVYCSVTGREAKAGDVLFSVRAPVGRLNLALEPMVIGRGLAAVRHYRGCQSYLYYLLSTAFSNEDIIGNGAIFNAVGKDELLSFKVLSPPSELVDAFEKLVKPIDEQLAGLIRQNEVLEKTKNQLLPRMISGKLSVENLDIQFPPSMQSDESGRTDEAAA